MKHKSINTSLIVALSIFIGACDVTEDTTQTHKEKVEQRDVYSSLEDCVADWGDTELCQQQMKEAREHAEKMAELRAKQGGTGTSFVPIFFGPSYIGDNRSITKPDGSTVTPPQNRAGRTANITTNPITNTRTFAYTPPKPPTPPQTVPSTNVSRGGFGTTGTTSTSSSGG